MLWIMLTRKRQIRGSLCCRSQTNICSFDVKGAIYSGNACRFYWCVYIATQSRNATKGVELMQYGGQLFVDTVQPCLSRPPLPGYSTTLFIQTSIIRIQYNLVYPDLSYPDTVHPCLSGPPLPGYSTTLFILTSVT